MRRKDLDSGILVRDGIYVLDGDEGDPEALVHRGPYPHTSEGRAAALAEAGRLHERTKRPATITLVLALLVALLVAGCRTGDVPRPPPASCAAILADVAAARDATADEGRRLALALALVFIAAVCGPDRASSPADGG